MNENEKTKIIDFPVKRTNRTFNIPLSLDRELGRLAALSGKNGISISAYVGTLVSNAVSQGTIFLNAEDGRTTANRKRAKNIKAA